MSVALSRKLSVTISVALNLFINYIIFLAYSNLHSMVHGGISVKIKNMLLITAILIAIGNISATAAGATTYTIGSDPENDFTSIQVAINDSSVLYDDIIIVNSGTYNENVLLNKRLSLIGNGQPVINGMGGSDSNGFLVSVFGMRFLIEFLKNPQVDFEATMLLNMGQILSIPLIIAGAVLWFLAKRRKKIAD